jgi:phosphoenolpyruvate-protein phosphotransferase
MRKFQGMPASSGIAIGPAWIYYPVNVTVHTEINSDPDAEWLRLMAAMNLARNQIAALEVKARENIGEEEAAIFDAHREFLDDVDLLAKIRKFIFEQQFNSELAVKQVFDEAANALAELSDPYLRARSQDVSDVANRLLRCLQGVEGSDNFLLSQPSIIIADDLTPSDTVQFDREKILGICTSKGGPTSHTAILSRSLGVPAIVSASFVLTDFENGILTILDGNSGLVTVGPSLNELSLAKEEKADWDRKSDEQIAYTHLPAITKDGITVEVVANIGGVEDAKKAIELGAEGVGLFRTEFLYLDRNELLDLNEQTTAYRGVMQTLGDKPLVVRTLDIGGDKSVPYLGLTVEQNPFLGWRGIRMVRERPDILANQFEALLIAGENSDLRIMLPMVSGVGEVLRAREILDAVIEKLKKQGIHIPKKLQFGIMIEVPSAALLAEHLAPLVDFFSIGTNDLTQYSLAVDRTNERVAALASPYNPAVLRLIKMTIDAAHKYGKWVGLCGELGGDAAAVPVLLGLGLDEFSMAPSSIPVVKAAIRKWTKKDCQAVAERVLALPGSTDVINYLQGITPG